MGQTSIDRIRGPHDGLVELILIQPADWESDPFLVKNLREKIASYKTYLESEEFGRNYANCSGVIVLETSHFPPEELQQLLSGAGVEVRITKTAPVPPGIELVLETNTGEIELVLSQLADWESDPFLVKNLRGKLSIYRDFLGSDAFKEAHPNAKGSIVLETVFAPPSEIREMLRGEGVSIRMAESGPAPQAAPAAPAPKPAQAAPAAPAAPKPAPVPTVAEPEPAQKVVPAASEEPKKPMFVQRKPEVDPDSWDDDPYDVDPDLTPKGGKITPAVIGSGVVALLCLFGFLHFFLGLGTRPVPTSPTMVPASAATAQGTPGEQFATVVVRPNPRTFVMIPIKSSTSGKQEYYFLFGVLDSKKVLVFAKQQDSKILKRIDMVKHSVTGEMSPKPVWKDDLLKSPDKIEKRTFTGRLEHAQRRKNGPVELVLPDQNRNVNKLYKRLGFKFPSDSVIMVVGEKPRQQGSGGLFSLVFLIAFLVMGAVTFAMFRQASSF